MGRTERLALIRQKYQKSRGQVISSPIATQKEDVKKDSKWHELLNILRFNKEKRSSSEIVAKEQNIVKVSKSEQPVVAKEQIVANNLRKNARVDALKERKLERQLRKADRVYAEAINKGLVKEGSLESIQLKNTLKDDCDAVQKYVKEMPVVQYTKFQDLDGDYSKLKRKQLLQSGVKYIDPKVDNNL